MPVGQGVRMVRGHAPPKDLRYPRQGCFAAIQARYNIV